MGGRSSDSDTDKSRKGKKASRSKRSRSPSSSGSVSSSSSDKRRHQVSSKYDSRNRSNKPKSSRRHRDRKDFSRSSYTSRQDRRYYQRSRSRSRERDKSKEGESAKKSSNPTSSVTLKGPSTSAKSTEDQIKMKMQMALKAAADADALLRQQGVLKAKEWGRNAEHDNIKPPKPENKWPKEPPMNVKDQIEQAMAIEEINSPGFQPQAFVSGVPPSASVKETDRVVETHDSAIFGGVADPNLISAPKPVAISTFKNMCVAHENLFENIEVKEERWIKKLMLMRQRKLNGEAMC